MPTDVCFSPSKVGLGGGELRLTEACFFFSFNLK